MHEIIKYGLVGVINTIIGYGVFLIAYEWAKFSPEMANAIGYLFGLCAAFILNKIFVFNQREISFVESVRFLIAFMLAFGLNQAMLIFLINYSPVPVEVAQIFAMAIYTVLFYLLSKYFVFVKKCGSVAKPL